MNSEFSEKEFEILTSAAILRFFGLSMPMASPSQRAEKRGGYDDIYVLSPLVKFHNSPSTQDPTIERLFRATSVTTLVVQYKVGWYRKTDDKFAFTPEYEKISGVYSYSQNKHLFNLMKATANSSIFVYYCAPLFYERALLRQYLCQDTLLQNVQCITPCDIPSSPTLHHLRYDSAGAVLCSQESACTTFPLSEKLETINENNEKKVNSFSEILEYFNISSEPPFGKGACDMMIKRIKKLQKTGYYFYFINVKN